MYTKHEWKVDSRQTFQYVKYLPKDFDTNKKYPLVFFLHGAGERGDDLDMAMRHGYMKYVRENGAEYPFICIAPQCPRGKYWGCYTESLNAFLEDMMDELPVDRNRVYLTGFSMGGTGTWMLAMAYPEKFAAIAPICGTGIYWNAGAVAHLPIFMYHGDCDNIVPVTESVKMLESVNKRGGNAKLKICYGVGHNAWDYAYTDEELMNWLLEQRKEKPL